MEHNLSSDRFLSATVDLKFRFRFAQLSRVSVICLSFALVDNTDLNVNNSDILRVARTIKEI